MRLASIAVVSTGLFALIGMCLLIGARPVGVHGLLHAFAHFTGSADDSVVLYLRLPRVLLGVLVGAALGVAGAILQGLTRNPLADPAVLGVNSGAALALVVAATMLHVSVGFWRGPLSVVGATLAVLMVYAGSKLIVEDTLASLVIVGSVLAGLLASVTTTILLCTGHDVTSILYWLVGSLNACDWSSVRLAAPFVLAGLAVSALLPGRLNALRLGPDVAQSISADRNITQALGLTAVVLLSAAVVASAGPIGFVGLLVAHFVRTLVGPDYRIVLPGSAVMGAALLLLCDLIARTSLWESYDEIPVGLVTACVGAPLLILLLQKKAVTTA